MHRADARVTLVRKETRSAEPEFTFEMTPLYGDHLQQASRSFTRLSETRLGIRDDFVFSPGTKSLTWQMITRAKVYVKKDLVTLKQDGKELYMHLSTEIPFEVKIVDLSPPPLSYDKDIPGLKRIEICYKREDFPGKRGHIKVELSNDK